MPTVLLRTVESLGENYPSGVLHNHETRMRVSDAIKYLREAFELTTRVQNSQEAEKIPCRGKDGDAPNYAMATCLGSVGQHRALTSQSAPVL